MVEAKERDTADVTADVTAESLARVRVELRIQRNVSLLLLIALQCMN
jgi:hypothetical protein